MVSEAKRNLGMARALMGKLIEIARKGGLKSISALVLKDNLSMTRVSQRFGFRQFPCDDPEEALFKLKLNP